MDWPTAFVSMGSSAATAGVAILAIVKQTRNAADDREHHRVLRKQERRSHAYLELMTALRRLETGVDRTAPLFVSGTPPEPPAAMTDEEAWHLSALADVVASDEVRELIEGWTKKVHEFYAAVWYLREVQQHEEGRRPSEVEGKYGVSGHGQWMHVHSIREELHSDLRAIGHQVRAEL